MPSQRHCAESHVNSQRYSWPSSNNSVAFGTDARHCCCRRIERHHRLVLDRGMQGELCTWLLFTLTRDRAVQPIVQLLMAKVQAVSLSQFLRTLLGDDIGINDKRLQNAFISTLSNISRTSSSYPKQSPS